MPTMATEPSKLSTLSEIVVIPFHRRVDEDDRKLLGKVLPQRRTSMCGDMIRSPSTRPRIIRIAASISSRLLCELDTIR